MSARAAAVQAAVGSPPRANRRPSGSNPLDPLRFADDGDDDGDVEILEDAEDAEDDQPLRPGSRGRVASGAIWKHFTRLDEEYSGTGRRVTYRCNLCSKFQTDRTHAAVQHQLHSCLKRSDHPPEDREAMIVRAQQAKASRLAAQRAKDGKGSKQSKLPYGGTAGTFAYQEAVDSLLVKWLARGGSFRSVDAPELEDFCKYLNPAYVLPSKHAHAWVCCQRRRSGVACAADDFLTCFLLPGCRLHHGGNYAAE